MAIFLDGSSARFNPVTDAVELTAEADGRTVVCRIPRAVIEQLFADQDPVTTDILVPLVLANFLAIDAAVSRKLARNEIEPGGYITLQAGDGFR